MHGVYRREICLIISQNVLERQGLLGDFPRIKDLAIKDPYPTPEPRYPDTCGRQHSSNTFRLIMYILHFTLTLICSSASSNLASLRGISGWLQVLSYSEFAHIFLEPHPSPPCTPVDSPPPVLWQQFSKAAPRCLP